ncbi:hypothetical protein AVEN_268397-1 [Araneus ventricosus]|uniref:Endonuclease/exonuclease/phosphatase domain-containing protein n=1 Tax=Araneus ventricosus TaxID=182803 RepID=A0A4Y2DW86_ARAVE|nr:hypothetical protein AVEN_268397-1 [Araneus ventricosus]
MWGSNNSTTLSNSFVDWLQNSNFVMLNTSNLTCTSYTGTNSLLDLTLCSTSIYHQVDCFVSDSTFESDHNPVITTWSLLGQTSKTIKTIDWNSIMKNTSEILSSTNSDLHTVMHKVSGIIKQNTKHSALPDKAQPPFMIKAHFEETISEEFQDYFIIATDASKSHIYTSIAGTSDLRSFSFRIHPINSIFTAEALATCEAIVSSRQRPSDLDRQFFSLAST